MTREVKLTVRALTPARWPDLEAVFMARGCSVARGCWCMFYRHSGRTELASAGSAQAARDRAALKKLAAADPPPGLIGYRGKTPVGWVAIGPRAHYAKLAKSPVMKPLDDAPAWSIVCFVVPSQYRHQGVAQALLEGAVAWARKRGARLLEGYPVDATGRRADDSLWFGTRTMFEAAGFDEVARRKPARPFMRLALAPD